MEKEPFLLIVFPTEKDPRTIAELATRFKRELTSACGADPLMVRPDLTALCLLVEGEPARIIRAIESARAMDTRYLLVRVEKPFVDAGLSTARAWLDGRLRTD